MGRRVILAVAKLAGGLAGVVFLLCPLRTSTQVLINVGAVIIAVICGVIIYHLDDSDDSGNSGYWPPNPAKSGLHRDSLPRDSLPKEREGPKSPGSVS